MPVAPKTLLKARRITVYRCSSPGLLAIMSGRWVIPRPYLPVGRYLKAALAGTQRALKVSSPRNPFWIAETCGAPRLPRLPVVTFYRCRCRHATVDFQTRSHPACLRLYHLALSNAIDLGFLNACTPRSRSLSLGFTIPSTESR